MMRFHDSSVISRNGSNIVDAGAGDEDLDRAELAAHRADGVVDRRAVGDVDRGTRAPRRRRLRRSSATASAAVSVDVEHGDAVPARGELLADRASHSRGAARDDRDALAARCQPPL